MVYGILIAPCAACLGDDDTMWFASGVKRLLARFNPQTPYFISDNLVDYVYKPK